ncbi:TetR/AcrR family transcriptional regulator [Burkholderia gladioli]|jgi:AcrR family transcriptional regulator|uniref:TetR/AcrR family transcriptional regulator n=1 Tax=Burkholderia gladioli TaxID=28095 RepID=UPI00163F3484|nr:TetR/AcrR family transcriptional regulator [Burkholderia gladioli]MBU9640290.1 TetR/AcrR family transcriptional regulator [Burkholderia gladioli]
MVRIKSQERRTAIMDAATRVIAQQGLGAPTALIAKEAGVSNGSLFGYFETKAELLNQLYVELKMEMGASATGGLPVEAELRVQLAHLWTGWLRWAVASPDKRRVLAQLSVSDEITAASRELGGRAMKSVAGILERCRQGGPMHDVPLGLVAGLMNAVAEATVDFILADSAQAELHGRTGFEAVWRMIR